MRQIKEPDVEDKCNTLPAYCSVTELGVIVLFIPKIARNDTHILTPVQTNIKLFKRQNSKLTIYLGPEAVPFSKSCSMRLFTSASLDLVCR